MDREVRDDRKSLSSDFQKANDTVFDEVFGVQEAGPSPPELVFAYLSDPVAMLRSAGALAVASHSIGILAQRPAISWTEDASSRALAPWRTTDAGYG